MKPNILRQRTAIVLIAVVLMVQLVSCDTGTVKKDDMPAASTDTSLFFSVIDKDSARIADYQYKKEPVKDMGLAFHYSNKADSFTLFIDTSKGVYTGKFGSGGMTSLELEKTNYYTVNGTDYKILKLAGDKDVTDGAFSLFLSPDFGLLISKSNTWRAAKVRCPDKDTTLMALLYRVQTDSEFFTNPVPALDNKIKTPKVE
jgi:hypothetical protein